MARKFGELRAKLSPESRARSEARARAILDEMALSDIRNAFGMSQQQVAEIMNVNQPAIAKIERRADVFVSTLRQYIESFGGKLRLVADFPEGSTDLLLAGQSASKFLAPLTDNLNWAPGTKIDLNKIKGMSPAKVTIAPKIVSENIAPTYETSAFGNTNSVGSMWFAAVRNPRGCSVSNLYA